MNNKKGEVPESLGSSADPPIAFRRESAMFFHFPEKYAGLGPSSSYLSFEHFCSCFFASRSNFLLFGFSRNMREAGNYIRDPILNKLKYFELILHKIKYAHI